MKHTCTETLRMEFEKQKVELPSGCWVMASGKWKEFRVQVAGKLVDIKPRRVAWLLKNGNFPVSHLYSSHGCSDKGCANPDHYSESEYQTMTLEEYFRAKVKVSESGCWDWQGKKFRSGYGYMCFTWPCGNGKRIPEYAHRVSWYIAFGVKPNGELSHSCDRPCCVNPDHLSLGTHADNMREMKERKRHGSVNMAGWNEWNKGEKNWNARLTGSSVASIREDVAGGMTYTDAGKKYGVSRHTVSRIIAGSAWKHTLRGGDLSPA